MDASIVSESLREICSNLQAETEKCKNLGISAYAEETRPKLAAWSTAKVELFACWWYGTPDSDDKGDDDKSSESAGKRKRIGMANRISKWLAEKSGSSGSNKSGGSGRSSTERMRTRARKRPTGRG